MCAYVITFHPVGGRINQFVFFFNNLRKKRRIATQLSVPRVDQLNASSYDLQCMSGQVIYDTTSYASLCSVEIGRLCVLSHLSQLSGSLSYVSASAFYARLLVFMGIV